MSALQSSINILNKYFDNIYRLSETLFKSVIKLNKKIDISSVAFSRLKTLSTLRFNYYPNQINQLKYLNKMGLLLDVKLMLIVVFSQFSIRIEKMDCKYKIEKIKNGMMYHLTKKL